MPTRVPDGEVVKLIDRDNAHDEWKLRNISRNDLWIAHNPRDVTQADTSDTVFPDDRGTVSNLEGVALYGYAPDGAVTYRLRRADFSINFNTRNVVRRPQDEAARTERVGEQSSSAVATSGTPDDDQTIVGYTAPAPFILEQGSLRVEDDVTQNELGQISVELKVEDENDNEKYKALWNASAQSSYSLNPGMRVREGWTAGVQVRNHGSIDMDCRAAINYRVPE